MLRLLQLLIKSKLFGIHHLNIHNILTWKTFACIYTICSDLQGQSQHRQGFDLYTENPLLDCQKHFANEIFPVRSRPASFSWRLSTWVIVAMCFWNLVEVKTSGVWHHSALQTLDTFSLLYADNALSPANMYMFSLGSPHISRVSAGSSIAEAIEGFRSTGTALSYFLPRFTSSSDFFLALKVANSILDTCPSLLL